MPATPWAFKYERTQIFATHTRAINRRWPTICAQPGHRPVDRQGRPDPLRAYQYARTDRDRLISQSIVKSIIGYPDRHCNLRRRHQIGRRHCTETYVPGFEGAEYGRDADLRSPPHVLRRGFWRRARRQSRLKSSLARHGSLARAFQREARSSSIVQFNVGSRRLERRYHYASIEPDVLGLVLHSAVNKSTSDYLQEKVWEPIGAEADARLAGRCRRDMRWRISASMPCLRDYARLGRLLAHDGAWRQTDHSITMDDRRDDRTAPRLLSAPGKAMPYFGYGYLLWFFPGTGVNSRSSARMVSIFASIRPRSSSWCRPRLRVPMKVGVCGQHWSSSSPKVSLFGNRHHVSS